MPLLISELCHLKFASTQLTLPCTHK